MVQDKDKVYLQHILDEIDKVENFLYGVEEHAFTVTDTTEKHYAVVRSLEIIGEAATKLSPEFRQAHRDIKWGNIIGMRNRIIHEYLDVDYQIVWDTVQQDLPVLKKALLEIVSDS